MVGFQDCAPDRAEHSGTESAMPLFGEGYREVLVDVMAEVNFLSNRKTAYDNNHPKALKVEIRCCSARKARGSLPSLR